MKHKLLKIFRVLPEESGKLMAFIVLAALLQAGMAVGIATADALFLSQLGAEKLPYVYLLLPLVTLIYAPIYSILLTRMGINKLFLFTLFILVVGGVGFGLAFTTLSNPPDALFYGIKVYSGLWFIAIYTLFWNFSDDYFAVLDGKRLFGIIAAGSSLGGILGAGLVSGLAAHVEPGYLFFAWSAFALLTVPVLAAVIRYPKLDFGFSEEEDSQSSWSILRTVGRALRTSRFALCLALICFTMVNLGALLEYLSFGVFEEGRDAAELAALLGKLYAIAAALTLIINLFLFSRVVGFLGVNNTTLIVPLAFFGSFVYFYLDAGMASALVAFYVLQSLFVAIEYTNINLLFNGLASGVRKHLRTFIEALGEPLATAAAGAFLLLYASSYGTDGVAFIGLVIGAVGIILALFIRSDYVQALATNLRENWLDLSLTGKDMAAKVNAEERKHLIHQALHGNDRSDRLLATELLWEVGDPQARKALLNYLSIAQAEDADRLSPIITGLLRHSDNATLAEILLWLETRSKSCPPEVMGEFLSVGAIPTRQLANWEASTEPSHRALLAVARWHNPLLDETHKALAEVRDMLRKPGPSRHWALRAIGDFRHPPQASELLPWITDEDPLTRKNALQSLIKLSPGLTSLPTAIIQRIPDADPLDLSMLLTIVARVADTSAVLPVLRIAARLAPTENQHIVQSIAGMGAKATPSVVRVLRDKSMAYRSRLLAARALERIAPPQIQAMADGLINEELAQQNPATRAEQLDFILEILSLSGSLPDLDLIRTSLARSNARDRANAVETIEQYVTRSLFTRLSNLIEAPVVPAT